MEIISCCEREGEGERGERDTQKKRERRREGEEEGEGREGGGERERGGCQFPAFGASCAYMGMRVMTRGVFPQRKSFPAPSTLGLSPSFLLTPLSPFCPILPPPLRAAPSRWCLSSRALGAQVRFSQPATSAGDTRPRQLGTSGRDKTRLSLQSPSFLLLQWSS